MKNLNAMTAAAELPNFLNPLSAAQPLRAIPTQDGDVLQAPFGTAEPSPSFAAQLSRLMDDARGRAATAQDSIESFARAEQPGRVHDVLIATTKAEISLRTLVTVRNKLVDAYKELLHVTT